MGERTQVHRGVAIGTSLGDTGLLLRSARITEELGRMFRCEVELLSEDYAVNFDRIVGKNATIRVERSEGQPTRYFNGYVSRFVLAGSAMRLAVYRATLVPWMWFLTRSSDCRIFQGMTVPDIIKKVFRDRGFSDFDDALSGSFRTWDYCVQYRETDFNFVSRLMEQEGIYYYFKHENGKHTLVLADSRSSHEACAAQEEIQYFAPGGIPRRVEHVSQWAVEQEVQPSAFALNDYNFETPKTPLAVTARAAKKQMDGEFEIYDYPGDYGAEGEGTQYARVRVEELQAGAEIARGVADGRGLATGGTFKLKDHPRDDQNKEYLITSAVYTIRSDEYASISDGAEETAGEPYSVSFTAIDATRAFRAARITPKPVIQGPQTAFVTGPAGEEIHTDKHGRVKVMFHWDRYAKNDDNSSCWVRVAQIWAGKKWGGMFIPRVGQEVIVEFLEGDPDRPIITGRVYNDESVPPYKLPDNKTMSTVKSLSSKGGGGFNELRFEDKKGEEQVFIHAERNLDVRVKSDSLEFIGHDRHLIVKNDKFEKVEKKRHEIVLEDHYEKVDGAYGLKVGKDLAVQVAGKHCLQVTGDEVEVFKANHSEKTTGNVYLKAGGTVVIEGGGGVTLKCGGNCVVVDATGVTVKGSIVTIDGSMTKINSGPGSPAGGGSAGSEVSPTAPTEAKEATTADPGENAAAAARQREIKKTTLGSVKVDDFKPPGGDQPPQEKISLAFQLLDAAGNPVSGEKCEILYPDGSKKPQTTDGNGMVRLNQVDNGSYSIRFPDRDDVEWEMTKLEDLGA